MYLTASRELEELINQQRREYETSEQCVLRLVRQAIGLQKGLDQMAEKVEKLWPPQP